MPTARPADNKFHLSPAERIQRRRLILQDTVALVSLTAIAICMTVLTYFFFHSFAEHRTELQQRWFARGQAALVAGRPAEAVEDFRSALSFSSGDAAYQLALAEALAASGRVEEANAYFLTLHDAAPGDGFINLQLARLAVRRKNPQQAIDDYQAALNGLWHGHGTERRLHIRLELAQYLLSLGRADEAQGDLLAAEGNSLDNPSALFAIAQLLRQADDPTDALTTYQRVERHGGASQSQVLGSLLAESQIAAQIGQYKRAALALDRYVSRARQHPAEVSEQESRPAEQQLARYQRMLQLIPFYGLPPKQHDSRVLEGAQIAHRRYVYCVDLLQSKNDPNASDLDLLALGTQWQSLAEIKPADLAGNAPLQDKLTTWMNQAELLTAKLCGPPSGDDALLLQLAQTPDKTE